MNNKPMGMAFQEIEHLRAEYKKLLSSKMGLSEKDIKKKELVAKLFIVVPTLEKNDSVEEFLEKYGKSDKDLALRAFNEYSIQLVENRQFDLEDVSTTEKVLIPTGNLKKVFIMNSEGEETDEYIQVPEMVEKEIRYISDVSKFIDLINENNSEEKIARLIDKSNDKLLTVIDNIVKLKKTNIETRSGGIYKFDLGTELKNKAFIDYYTGKTAELINSFEESNGILKDKRAVKREHRVTLPSGEKVNKSIEELIDVVDLSAGRTTPMARFLLNSGYRNEKNQNVNIYTDWKRRLYDNITENLPKFLEANPLISDVADIRFDKLFVDALDKSADELKNIYKISEQEITFVRPEIRRPQQQTFTNYMLPESEKPKPMITNPIPSTLLTNYRDTPVPQIQKEEPSKALPFSDDVENIKKEKLERIKNSII